MKKPLTTLTLFSLLLVQAYGKGASASTDHNLFIEKKKTIVKVYEVAPHDQLNIDNQFGDVKINLWNKKEIRIDIVVSANASSESRAVEYLNVTTVEERKEGNTIFLKTEIGRTSFNNSWGNRREDNSIRIDYLVSMPKSNPLTVKNKFGNTEIPVFSAPLTIETMHGNFRAQDLENSHNDIRVMYGNASIGKMDAGKVDARYSKLDVSEVKTLVLSNKHGPLNIGEVGSLKADIDYSGARVGALTVSGNVNLTYSDGFIINQNTADNINIKAAYSSVVLPAESSKFDVTVSYGSFQYPDKSQVSFTNYPEKDGHPGKARQYEGVIGNGAKVSNIKIVSKYGSVRMKK